MDLNKAMVDLYQKRSAAAATNKHKKAKRPKVELEDDMIPNLTNGGGNNQQQTSRKRGKIEELLASLDYKPKTTFDELYGCESARNEILEYVNLHKRAIEGLDSKSDWPILICGSKGLGKTAIVEAAANHANLKLIPIFMKSLVKQTRNGANWAEFRVSLKIMEKHCLANQPAIVLIDDVDQLNDKEDLKLLLSDTISNLLAKDESLLVFCTTPSILDGVSGIDFLSTIHLKRPNLEAREKILENLCNQNKNLTHLTHDCLKHLAFQTPSFTALDLRKMLNIARAKSTGSPTLAQCEKAVDVVKQSPSFRRGTHLISERPTVSWNDIGGLSEVRQAFRKIHKQIKKDDINCKFAGILLYGPPGCGKTMAAKAMANEAGFNFISIKPAELVDKFLGETEKNIRRVFSEAQEHEPCMIYFDEFDGLCGTRGNRDTVANAIQTLLNEMDGLAGRGKSIILASTNRLEDIDPAMKRSGRLSEKIYVGLPDMKARLDILSVITNRPSIKLDEDVDLDFWARKTDSFSGADLHYLVYQAESQAEDELDESSGYSVDKITLKKEHFDFSINKIRATNQEVGKRITTVR